MTAPLQHEEQSKWRRGPLAWMAQNSVAANLLMLVLIIGGVLFFGRIKQEVFPETTLDFVQVQIPYPGASPRDVEQGVILAVEEAIQGVEGVEEIRSVAAEGGGQVTAELFADTDKFKALNEIKNEVDRITSFPEDAERPIISLGSNRRQVASLVIYGPLDRETLKQLGEEVRSELLRDPRITMVELEGLPPPEISIEIPQKNLRRYNLTLEEIARRVNAASTDLPGGGVKTATGETLLRTTERRDYGSEFEDISVVNGPDGTRVLLKDLGRVVDGFRDTERESWFNGQQAVSLRVFRIGEQTPLDVSAAVQDWMKRNEGRYPEKVHFALWNDTSEIFDQRIGLLVENGRLGLILVIAVLGLFLRLRLAFWVMVGMFTAFVGAFLFMPAMGVSINMISLFAFLLAIGIVVDDAIVVGEAIYKQRMEGQEPLKASVEGVREVAAPVTFSVITTVIAFSPLLFVPGVTGKFFANIPMIVIPILLISLMESLFVLPAHLAHLREGQPKHRITRWFAGLQKRFASGLDRFVNKTYWSLARQVIVHRYIALAGCLALLVITAGFIAGGRLPFNFLPKVEGNIVRADVELPFGAPAEDTRAVMDELVRNARTVFENFGDQEKFSRGILAELGLTGVGDLDPGQGSGSGPSGSHLGSVAVFLVESDHRPFKASEFAARWRKITGELPGVERLAFTFSAGPEAGAKVAIELAHEDVETLRAAATRLADSLKSYEGVFDIDDGFQIGKEQIELKLKPAARSLGVNETELGRQVRSAFFGSESFRQQRGRDEVRVYVRRPKSERESEYFVKTLMIKTPGGGEMPLDQAAYVQRGRSFTQIQREEGRRVVDVTADVDAEITTGGEVTRNLVEKVLPYLLSDFPGLSYELSGEQQQQTEALGSLWNGLILAFFAMFALMAVAFRSYAQPLIVMSAIPFGMVGAIGGHLLMGFELSLISLFGMVALSGVVVNDSLVLVAAINQYRREGSSILAAVLDGGKRRFRPILLTSLTTFFGLLPMIFETSVQAQFLIPMAISLGFGVLFVTVIALLIVPVLYLVLDDIRELGRQRFRSSKQRGEIF